jgi:hypothetical protein
MTDNIPIAKQINLSPLLSEEGWPRPQQDIAKPPFWSGRGGDQIPQRILSRLDTTPSARAKDASRCFLDRAATPPQRGGENSPLHHGQQPREAGDSTNHSARPGGPKDGFDESYAPTGLATQEMLTPALRPGLHSYGPPGLFFTLRSSAHGRSRGAPPALPGALHPQRP